jgi:hypothetical protein
VGVPHDLGDTAPRAGDDTAQGGASAAPRPPRRPTQDPIAAPIPAHGNGAPAQPSEPSFINDTPPPGRPGTSHRTIEWRVRIAAVLVAIVVFGLAAYSATLVVAPDNAPPNADAGTVVPLQVTQVRVVQGGDVGSAVTDPPRVEVDVRNPSSVPQRVGGLRLTVTDVVVATQCGTARPEPPADAGTTALQAEIGATALTEPTPVPGGAAGVVTAEVAVVDPAPDVSTWLRLDVEALDAGGAVVQRTPTIVTVPRPLVSSMFDPSPDGSTECARSNADGILRLAAGSPVMSPQTQVAVRGAASTAARR